MLVLLTNTDVYINGCLKKRLSSHFAPNVMTVSVRFLVFTSLLLVCFFTSCNFLSTLLVYIYANYLFTISSPRRLLLLRCSPNKRVVNKTVIRLTFGLKGTIKTCFKKLSVRRKTKLRDATLVNSFFTLLKATIFLMFGCVIFGPREGLLLGKKVWFPEVGATFLSVRATIQGQSNYLSLWYLLFRLFSRAVSSL